jgi:protocatechuate 3,4-dioxygenase beta subunit
LPLGSCATDDTGRFTFDGVTSGAVVIAIDAEGFAPRSDESIDPLLAAGGLGAVTLFRSCEVRGRVFDLRGLPLAKAPVSMSIYAPYPEGPSFRPNAVRAVTNEAGEFVFENVPPGRHLVIYPWQGAAGRATRIGAPVVDKCCTAFVQLAEGQVAPEVSLDLATSRCALEGKVTDGDGSAVGDVEVRVFAQMADNVTCSIHGPDYPAGRSSPEGNYRLDGLPPGEWIVVAASPTHGRSQPTKVYLTPGRNTTCNLVLE